MKSPVKKQLFLLALVAVGVVGSANAQRNGGHQGSIRSFDRSNSGSRSGSFVQAPSFNRSNNFAFNNQTRHEAFSSRLSTPVASTRQFPGPGNRNVISSPRRNVSTTLLLYAPSTEGQTGRG